MRRRLLTGLSLASVAGTGGIAFASMLRPPDVAQSAPLEQVTAPDAVATTAGSADPSTSPAVRSVTYQVGDAGWVTVDATTTTIAVRSSTPQADWRVAASSASAGHISVQFTDGRRIVGVDVGLVGSDLIVSATNELAPGSLTSAAASGALTSGEVASTAPAAPVPVASPAPVPSGVPTVTAAPKAPARSATTATSAAGGGGTPGRGEGHGDSGGENDD